MMCIVVFLHPSFFFFFFSFFVFVFVCVFLVGWGHTSLLGWLLCDQGVRVTSRVLYANDITAFVVFCITPSIYPM